MTDNEKLIERLRAVIDTAVTDAYTAASQMNATAADDGATARDVNEAEAVLDLVVSALEAAEKALTPTDDERGDLIGAASAAFNARGGAPEWEDDEIARDLIIRWHLRGFEDGEKFGRRPEVPELPTPEAWRDSIVDERCQQPSKGYTSDHDREHGLDHLLEWAQEYARIGEPLKSAALIEAARDLHRAGEVPEPSTEEFRRQIAEERERQIECGYDAEHDRAHGVDHLLRWAQDYARRGRSVQSAALIEAAREMLREDAK